MKLLGITSCPNGIAFTYMAAKMLEKAAIHLGVDMKVETRGCIGVENELTLEEIAAADGIIIAAEKNSEENAGQNADKNVDKNPFVGKRLIETTVTESIKNPEGLICRFLDGDVPVYGS